MKDYQAGFSYKSFYTDMNFERAGLFELIKNNYGRKRVLYPGCSIHITPSFYFQHIVYVDKSDEAMRFFHDTEGVSELINGHKAYRESSYVKFLHMDYAAPLPLREYSFDLLISLFAPCTTASCKKYLETGGLILSNNHLGDVSEALNDASITLEAVVKMQGKQYKLCKESLSGTLNNTHMRNAAKTSMKKTNHGLQYIDNELYYILKKNK